MPNDALERLKQQIVAATQSPTQSHMSAARPVMPTPQPGFVIGNGYVQTPDGQPRRLAQSYLSH